MGYRSRTALLLLSLLSLSLPLHAGPAPFSSVGVAEGVWALIGSTGPRTYENHALNANYGIVITEAGTVLIDSGASAGGARLIEAQIARITEQPVRWVINTGSQDHRWLGNGYFAAKGAEIIALERTVATQRAFASRHAERMAGVLRERAAGTQPVHPARPLAKEHAVLELGGTTIELHWFADAHFPGDAVVWLPEQRIAFTGDLVYVDRMLGVHPWSDVAGWRSAFEALTALEPRRIVPGHGEVCDLAKARRETGDYLQWLLVEVGRAIEDWQPLEETVSELSDAPAFAHLQHFDSWHRTNLNRTYLQLEAQ